jgi:hypothetical protein
VAAGVLLLAVPVALVAIAEGAGAIPLPFNLFVVAERVPVMMKLHMLTAGLALLVIPLVIALRRQSRWHRPLGWLAVASVVLGGLSSIPVAVMSDSVTAARTGFLAQGLVWMGLVAAGLKAVRERRYRDHARLMLAMAAVASGAIWVRLVTAVAVRAPEDFDTVYACVAWLGWLVPLAAAWLLGPAILAPRRTV